AGQGGGALGPGGDDALDLPGRGDHPRRGGRLHERLGGGGIADAHGLYRADAQSAERAYAGGDLMATARVYASSEREAASPGQRQQAFDQGQGQIGAGLQALGQGLNQYAQAKDAFNARLDEAAAAELDAGFANAVRGIEREFTAAQGRNAVDIA